MQSVKFLNLELDPVMLWLALATIALLFLLFIIFEPRRRRNNRRLREQYKFIYRVISTPSDDQFVLKADGTSIEDNDYGWEAEPVYQDGLIYLHGLNPRWEVVWYVGFRPEQVEIVGPKPKSQYNIFPYWVDASKVPQCPFAVQKYQYRPFPVKKDQYKSFDFGFPVEIKRLQRRDCDWVQGNLVPKHK